MKDHDGELPAEVREFSSDIHTMARRYLGDDATKRQQLWTDIFELCFEKHGLQFPKKEG